MKRALVAVGLVALAIGVFGQVRNHEFLRYDDPIYVVENPNLRESLGAESLWRAFREPYETNWIPLTWISLQADYALYGAEPAGYLLTNVALHAASAVLLFLALARMTGATWRPAFVAAVFAVHPLHVESVAWVSERKDSLSGLFFMLALLAYARYAEGPRLARHLTVLFAFLLGLLAKPMLVTLPGVLLLLDYWPLGRLRDERGSAWPDPGRVRIALLEKLPLFVLAAAASVVTFVVQSEAGAMEHGDALPFGVRLPNASIAAVAYLQDTLWPVGLAVFYPHPGDATSLGLAAVATALLLAITGAAAYAAPRRPYLLVGWLWYLGMLLPVIGLVQVGMQARADRYMYLPLVGLCIAAAWGASDLARGPRARAALALAATGIVLACAGVAWRQVAFWRDTETLYRRATSVTRDNFLAHHGLGSELLARGASAAALAHFREAVRVKPRWPGAHIGLADALLAEGQYEAAILAYERGLRVGPRHTRGHIQLARALAGAGRSREAIGRARHALTLAEGRERAEAHAVLGAALMEAGDLDTALQELESAQELDPELAEAHAQCGLVLLRLQRPAEAERALRRAIELGLAIPDLYAGLGDAAHQQGHSADALHHYRTALDLDPSLVHAANNLAWALATTSDPTLRDPEEAVRLARGVAEATDFSEPRVLDTLAHAYAAANRPVEAARTAGRAAEIAEAGGQPALASQLRERAAAYRRRAARAVEPGSEGP
jgi:tetratricopeptide (TPR) repeat protein